MADKVKSINYFVENLEDKMVKIIAKNIGDSKDSNTLVIDPTILILIQDTKIELMKIIKNKDGGIQIDSIPLAGILLDDHSKDNSHGFNVPSGICKKGKRWVLCFKNYTGTKKSEIFLNSIMDEKISTNDKMKRLEALILQKNFKKALNDNTIKKLIITSNNEKLGKKFQNIVEALHGHEKFTERDDKIKELLKNVEYVPVPEEGLHYYAFFDHLNELIWKDNRYLLLDKNNGKTDYKLVIYENSKFKEVSPSKNIEIKEIDKIGLLLNGKPRPAINYKGIRFFEDIEDLQRNGVAKYIIIKDKLIDLEFNELKKEYKKLQKVKQSLNEKKERIVSLIHSLSLEFNNFLNYTDTNKYI